ncbi:MAG: DUF481 domain-containing protein [Verrucomicrobia bacterium]|nr:DUF481 domain-containing protein [Verrucomicrobiota bacterium]
MHFKFKSLSAHLALVALVALHPSMLAAATEEVRLKSGERLLGEVLPASNEQTLHLRSKILGDLKLPRNSVASIKELPGSNPPATPKPAVALVPTPKQPPAPAKPAPASKPTVAEAESEALVPKHILKYMKEFKTPPSWKGNLRLGLNINAGSSDWTERYARGQLSIQPKGSKHFYRFGGSYSFRENEYANGSTRVTSDKYDLSGLYRRSFSKGWFVQNALANRVDNIKGIDRETKFSLGAGYKFKAFKDKIEINVGSGIGLEDYQASKASDLRNGQNYIGNIFQELTWKITKRATFSQKFNYFRNMSDAELYDYNFSAAFRTRLTDVFGLEFSYRKDYDSEVGGKEKDDTQWRSAFVIYF